VDKSLFSVPEQVALKLTFSIAPGFIASLLIDGRTYLQQPILPELCDRCVILAWNDHRGDLVVKVRDLALHMI
jgi:hypothetical protein